MRKKDSRPLGILNLERGPAPSPPRLGSILHPSTFEFPIISETVEGAWADVAMSGDPAIGPATIAAAKRLVQRGAAAISSNCASFIHHQEAVAASVNVPVATSSLLLLPALLRQLPPTSKIAVVSADASNSSERMHNVIDPVQRSRLVIGGIEGGKLYRNEMKRPPAFTETTDIEADVATCVSRLLAANPEIASILFECTAFPPVSLSIRRMTNLPIYDIAGLCRMMMDSVAHDGARASKVVGLGP
ncbi:hypothetical protein [Bradyrhizobium sp. CCBAU 45384]|uniref:hypothetical protein n=1 Tax=Bradyrhizobium sp. CCBAU 45384 TaxID=858428 RepID=UPI002305BC88|nr:hypothetical protein [Bradyrhizobium sp. CCBAU 45384]MDA9405339.1 hypothetical protein [Bradyrhizobium sp. CCBAU 45384]